MMQAMIFAAGLGTRLKPLTDNLPKALVCVGGETLLKRVVETLKDAGADRIVVNVHHFADKIIEYLKENDNFGADIRISDESEMLLDTGGGLRKAATLFIPDVPILLHNVDILSNVDIRNFYDSADKEGATLLVSERKTKRYLLFDENMRLRGWTNIETGEVRSPYGHINPADYRMYAFSGIHVISPQIFHLMDGFPKKFGIMDFYIELCNKVQIKGFLKKDLQLVDVGKLTTLHNADEFLQSLKNN